MATVPWQPVIEDMANLHGHTLAPKFLTSRQPRWVRRRAGWRWCSAPRWRCTIWSTQGCVHACCFVPRDGRIW